MSDQMIAEHIPHGYNIMLITINSQTVHSQVLRKKSLSMSFDNILKIKCQINTYIHYDKQISS